MMHLQGGALPINTTELKIVPVKNNKDLQLKIENITKKIIENETSPDEGQAKINNLIYKLYDLSSDEIKLIEESFN